MKTKDEVEMEIFRAGDYGAKGKYTEETLERIAADYRPDLLEAPLTFDHAQTGPAYGWVTQLRRSGDRLVAVLKGVPEAVRDMMRSGAYKRRSVELFRALPQTGRPYLRAVSLLGAATPEVKGLRNVCFSANPLASPDNEAVQLPAPEDDEANALRSRLLESRVALLFSELRADGYCLPERDAQALRHIFATHESTVQFSDGTAEETLDWMNSFLRGHLQRAPLGEQAASAGRTPAPAPDARFSQNTHPRSIALHQAAMRLQAESPGMAYRDALCMAARA